MSEKKYYVVGTKTGDAWNQVHELLSQDGTLEDNIPTRAVDCTDFKEHSDTRAVYLLTDDEAEMVRQHPKVRFVDLDQSKYPDLYPPKPDELHMTPRYSSNVKNYKNFFGMAPQPATAADLNRAGYQLLRSSQFQNPWQGQSVSAIIESNIPNTTNTGKNVDLIVGDDGCWFGHVEFNRNSGTGPADYVGGNKLPGNGTCDLLDLVLDSPYYIDSAWFNADPGNRLTTRWDGTIVPIESVAREWWGNSSARSSQFSSAGTVSIPSVYTRAFCNGSNTALSETGDHGTACAGLAYGRTYGWAYNANKWFINAYGVNSVYPIDNYFDIMKIFHNTKPINPLYGTKDPTISSNSWGFRATTPSTGYYYFRQGTTGIGGTQYTNKPSFMLFLGSAGDGGRSKGEMVDNSLTVSGEELIESGVIFVVAGGNSNQKQVGSDKPDYNNYWSLDSNTPLSSAIHNEFGYNCYNTTSRRGFPQQLGKYTSSGNVVYPVINIGALDDDNQPDGKERKVNYSDMGSEIDGYSPGDGVLTSNRADSPQYPRYDSYPGATVTSTDTRFTGTSAACPVAAGLIATLLETNRSYTWSNVRAWLQSLNNQSESNFYQGPDPSTASSFEWGDRNSLMGGQRKVIYNNIGSTESVSLGGSGLSLGGSGLSINF